MASVEFERVSDNQDLYRTGAKAIPEIIMDFSALTKDERNQEHMGSRILCVAALACFTNTMANALQNKGAVIKSMSGSAAAGKEKDDRLRTRYTTLEINVEVGLDEKDRAIFEAVRENMLGGSLLTYSLEEGMDVDYNISMKAM